MQERLHISVSLEIVTLEKNLIANNIFNQNLTPVDLFLVLNKLTRPNSLRDTIASKGSHQNWHVAQREILADSRGGTRPNCT